MKNNQKGITLIALVVTIIVLLILAGVSIAMLTGEGGILGNAREASAKTKLMNIADEISREASEVSTEYMKDRYVNATPTTYADDENLGAAIDKAIITDHNSGKWEEATLSGSASEGYTLTGYGYEAKAAVSGGSGSMIWSEPTPKAGT